MELSAAWALGAAGCTAGGALLDHRQQLSFLVEPFGVRATPDAVSIHEDSRNLHTQPDRKSDLQLNGDKEDL